MLTLASCSTDLYVLYLTWHLFPHISMQCTCFGNLFCRSLYNVLALEIWSTDLYVLYLLCLLVPHMSMFCTCLSNLFHISLYTALCLDQCDTNRVNTILSCIIQGSQDKQACTVPSLGCFIDAIAKNFTMEMLLMEDILGENLTWQWRACLV